MSPSLCSIPAYIKLSYSEFRPEAHNMQPADTFGAIHGIPLCINSEDVTLMLLLQEK